MTLFDFYFVINHGFYNYQFDNENQWLHGDCTNSISFAVEKTFNQSGRIILSHMGSKQIGECTFVFHSLIHLYYTQKWQGSFRKKICQT